MSRPVSRDRRYGRLYTNVMEALLSPQAKLLAAVIDWHAPRRRVTTARLVQILGCKPRMVRYFRQELDEYYATGRAFRPWKGKGPKGLRLPDPESATAGGGNRLPHYSPDSSLDAERGSDCNAAIHCRPPHPVVSGAEHHKPNWALSRTAWRRRVAGQGNPK